MKTPITVQITIPEGEDGIALLNEIGVLAATKFPTGRAKVVAVIRELMDDLEKKKKVAKNLSVADTYEAQIQILRILWQKI